MASAAAAGVCAGGDSEWGGAECGCLTDNFDAPNPDDSFRTFAEQVLEDIIVGGYGAIEVQIRPGGSEAELLQSTENPHFSQKAREMGHPAGESPSGRTNASAATQALPLVLWPVDGASIRMNLDWDGSPTSQRYMQVNDQSGANSQIKLDDDELIYIRLNPRTHHAVWVGAAGSGV